MRHRILIWAVCMMSLPPVARACNLSFFVLNSLSMSGSNYELSATLCIGAGRTGVVFGGDGATMDMALGIWRAAGPVNIVSYSPTSVTSSFTGCNMDIYDIGPEPTTFFTQATLYFFWDPFTYPSCTNGFTCTNSTALCGNIHQDCITFTLTLDALPDSLRFYGVEGNGNPFTGCSPNPDMLIDLSTLSLTWAGQSVQFMPGKGVQLEWSCWTPNENGQFGVERRSAQDTAWQSLAAIIAPAKDSEPAKGTFLDSQPLLGKSLYRIRHFLPSGISQTSEAMEVNVISTSPTMSPNPVSDNATLQTGLSEAVMGTVEMVGIDGKRHLHIEGELKPLMNLDLSPVPPGIYHVGVMLVGRGTTWLRILKQ